MESPDIDHFDPKTDDVLPKTLLERSLEKGTFTINGNGSSPLVVGSSLPTFLPPRVRDYLKSNGVIGGAQEVRIPTIHDDTSGEAYFYNPTSGDRIFDRSGMY